MEKAKEKKSYTAPVVRSVAFQIEKGFFGSPEGSTTPQTTNFFNESYREGQDIDGNIFGSTF